MQIVSDDPGFHDGQKIDRIDLKNAIHPAHRNHDSAANGNRTSGISDTATARNDRNFLLIRELYNGGDFAGVGGKDNGIGRMNNPGRVSTILTNGDYVSTDVVRSHNCSKRIQHAS